MVIEFLHARTGFKVLVSRAIVDQLVFVCNQFHPNEHGGILTGLKLPDCWIITDFETPDSVQASRTNFTRQVVHLNRYLADIYQQSKGHLQYLGEWHSHPDSSTRYSYQDEQSMREISQDQGTKNVTPLLWIFRSGKKMGHQLYRVQESSLEHFTLK